MSSIVQLEWVIGSRVASSFCLGEGSLLFCGLGTILFGEDSLSGESSDRRVLTDNRIRTQEQVVEIIDSALVTLISCYSVVEERSLIDHAVNMVVSLAGIMEGESRTD